MDVVLNVWVAAHDDLAAAYPVTHDTSGRIRVYRWACTDAHNLSIQDSMGDANWQSPVVDLQTHDMMNALIVGRVSRCVQ
jgi:hypothetical protein